MLRLASPSSPFAARLPFRLGDVGDRWRALLFGAPASHDPAGRHRQRYWDGAVCIGHVADDGTTGVDPA